MMKETYYNEICVSYYRGLKALSTMHKGYRTQFRYSPDTTTKDALKHFKQYLKTI